MVPVTQTLGQLKDRVERLEDRLAPVLAAGGDTLLSGEANDSIVKFTRELLYDCDFSVNFQEGGERGEHLRGKLKVSYGVHRSVHYFL